MAEPPVSSFAGLLRQLRTNAGMTQEQLAEHAGLSPRSISDLERGIHMTARRETTHLLANALRLTGPPESRSRRPHGGVRPSTAPHRAFRRAE